MIMKSRLVFTPVARSGVRLRIALCRPALLNGSHRNACVSLLVSPCVGTGLDLYRRLIGIKAYWRVADAYLRTGGIVVGLVGAGYLLHSADRLLHEQRPIMGAVFS